MYYRTEEIRLNRDIHYFVRGMLSWEDYIRLLDEIIDDPEWMDLLFIDILFYEFAEMNSCLYELKLADQKKYTVEEMEAWNRV